MRRMLLLWLLMILPAGFPSAKALSLEEAIRACPIPYEVMWAIAKAEYHKAGYPYIIRINSKMADVEIPWLRKVGKNAYDCENYQVCVYVARELIKKGITNIDLGPFQINYFYHRFPPEQAFKLPESYQKACQILTDKVRRHGWNLRGIASYHSTKPEENRKYAMKLEELLFNR